MRFHVEITLQALAEADEAYLYLQKRSPAAADAWFAGLFEMIDSLEQFPARCMLAPENDAFEEEIRQRLHGVYRILFTIRDDTVYILHIRHGAREVMSPPG